MKNLDLNYPGIQELNIQEMQETDGGLVLIIIGICATAALLTSSCIQNNSFNFQSGTDISNTQTNTTVADTSFNNNQLEIPIDLPIGY